MLRLGSPGEDQLDLLPGNVTKIPPGFHYHPFRFIDWKEEARIQKQAALRLAERTTEVKGYFYMDFGFMHTSTSNYSQPSIKHDRVVLSYDGFLSYLLIIDKTSRHAWIFLITSKEPPLDIVDAFLERFGHDCGGGPSVPIKGASWLVRVHFPTWFCGCINMCWNQLWCHRDL
jgi:hypothetical protein